MTGTVADHADDGARVFTEKAKGYLPLKEMGYGHEPVRHSVAEYVRGMAHTNGMESFWAILKRGCHGGYHQMSPEHLHRYVAEFQGRHNQRPLDTGNQMAAIVRGMDRKRLTYAGLVSDGVHARRRENSLGLVQ